MNEADNKNIQRVHLSKSLKRKILLEAARGEKLKDIFLRYDFNPDAKDKKYLAKLLHKWRKELYKEKEILQINAHKIDKDVLEQEVCYMGTDTEEDIVQVRAIERFKKKRE